MRTELSAKAFSPPAPPRTGSALDIAVRYALQAKQFSAPGEEREVVIMD